MACKLYFKKTLKNYMYGWNYIFVVQYCFRETQLGAKYGPE